MKVVWKKNSETQAAAMAFLASMEIPLVEFLAFRTPPYTHFGTWKKLCYMKFVLVGLYCGPLLMLIPPLTRT